jgi:antitoxin MazE
MRVRIQKWGNSLALRIPKSFALETKIEPGANVELSLVEGRIVICPVSEREYLLDDLLAGVTAENLHPEVATGGAVGRETW